MVKLKQIVTNIWTDDRQSDFSNPLCSFLYTCSLIYGGIVRLRNVLYDSGVIETKRLPCPVVSVGNLTVGGTGKTPMVIMLATLLKDKGYRPAVLSRGYGGEKSGKIDVVSDGECILLGPDEAGDEPVLIAASTHQVPVLTGADRFTSGQYAVDYLKADVLLLDDAFQHRRLHRDLNILLLDAARPFGNGSILPRGPLREPRSALNRADMVVLTRMDEKNQSPLESDLEREFPGMPVFKAVHRPAGLCKIRFPSLGGRDEREGEIILSPDFLKNKRVFAFAGIAQPDSFKKMIESLGAEIAAFRAFPDHHRYSATDMDDILRASRESGAEIILTTEKDGVKLPELKEPLPDLYMLRIEMDILSDQEKMADLILARLHA